MSETAEIRHIGHNSEVPKGQIKAIVERIEHLDLEIKELGKDKAEIYLEAKGNGFDVKALRAAISRRKANANRKEDHEAQVELYMAALASLVRP